MDGCKMTFPFKWSLFSGSSFISREGQNKKKKTTTRRETSSAKADFDPSWSPIMIRKKKNSSTLKILGPSYRGTWTCIAGFWDLQTISFEIPWFLGQVTSTSALARCYPKSHPMYPSNPWSLKSMVHNAMEFHQWQSEASRLPPHGKMWKFSRQNGGHIWSL